MEAFCHSPDRCLDDPFWIAIVRIDKGAVCFPLTVTCTRRCREKRERRLVLFIYEMPSLGL